MQCKKAVKPCGTGMPNLFSGRHSQNAATSFSASITAKAAGNPCDFRMSVLCHLSFVNIKNKYVKNCSTTPPLQFVETLFWHWDARFSSLYPSFRNVPESFHHWNASFPASNHLSQNVTVQIQTKNMKLSRKKVIFFTLKPQTCLTNQFHNLKCK